jgi:hypothetical protein
MTIAEKSYIAYYTPLIQEFVREVEHLPHPEIDRLPEPFLPVFGKHYETSALRLVIMGQDTRGWGDLRHFIAEVKKSPEAKLRGELKYFTEHPFTEWGPRRQSFWGFAMMLLAALHGREDWSAMKQGKMTEILDSFAWGNGNAVELKGSSAATKNVQPAYWDAVRQAGRRFDRFSHLLQTLQPQVAVIMYRGLDVAPYFQGCRPDGMLPEVVFRDGRLTHYRLPEAGVDVFHVPHPGSMNRHEGADAFRDQLKALFLRHGLAADFPTFLEGQQEGQKAMDYLKKNAPRSEDGRDKYECVAWVADELKKRDTFMSVPALCTLLNEHGYRTNYGAKFSGGRGSYRLVSGTYHRMVAAQQPARAHNVAVAFRRPNFEYAYSED